MGVKRTIRTELIQIRVSVNEKAEIEQSAEWAELPVSAYLRAIAHYEFLCRREDRRLSGAGDPNPYTATVTR